MSGIARQRLLDLSCFFSGLLLLVVSFGIAANGSELPMLLVYLGLFLFASPGLWAVLRLERRGQDGVPGPLSEDEFAQRCEDLMRPKADELEPVPEALPKSLRDEGFTRDPGLYDHFVLRPTRLKSDVHPGPRPGVVMDGFGAAPELGGFGTVPFDPSDYVPRGGPNVATIGKRRPRPKWLVADREFTPHTHCPAGHIATHHVTGRDEHEGQDVVLRECWYEACGLTWAEKAWTVGETA